MADLPDLQATRDCYCLSARKSARALTRLYEEKLRPHGLRATQFSILAALSLKGSTAVSELADLLGLERTSLIRAANLMERKGWLSSDRSRDGRERLLHVTGIGSGALQAALPAWKEAQDQVDREIAGDRNRLIAVSLTRLQSKKEASHG